MPRFKHHFMRIFVTLLVTVFFANTVYAGGMMVSANIGEAQSAAEINHSHEDTGFVAQGHAQHHQHISAAAQDGDVHDSKSHTACKQCNHCLACYSILLPSIPETMASANSPVLTLRVTSLYLSPTSPLLQRPPIA
jgi:hypothetical protein